MINPFEEINQRLDRIENILVDRIPKKEEVIKYRSREETATILQITLPTLNRYTALGLIKGLKVGNRVLYSDEAIQEALQDATSLKYRRQ